VENENILRPEEFDKQQNKGIENSKIIQNQDHRNNNNNREISQQQQGSRRFKIKRGLKIKLDYEFCKCPISASPYVYRFATYERFFCCTGCMSGYKQKYACRKNTHTIFSTHICLDYDQTDFCSVLNTNRLFVHLLQRYVVLSFPQPSYYI
jgi:hypothetical protein